MSKAQDMHSKPQCALISSLCLPNELCLAFSAGSLLAAWQGSNSHAQRRDVISWISKRVQDITENDAQALNDKDPEHAGFYDELCNRLTCCNGS